MATEKFRRQLRQEAEQWWHEGLINASVYDRLSQRYQFSEIETTASNGFVTILLGLGGILLGLGAITFVAANWEEWSRAFRVVLLLALFVGVNAAGFYLWRRPSSKRGLQRLGHGLLLTGALVLGANMALMSQMFHQSGDLYELLLVWGLGVAVMAYSLRLTSLGVLSWILLLLGYASWWGVNSFSTTTGWASEVMIHAALLGTLLFVPLAYLCRSRALFALAGIGFALSFVFNLHPFLVWQDSSMGLWVAIAFTLPPALLWAYDPAIWRFSRSTPRTRVSSRDPVDDFPAIARSLSVWFFAALLYWFSFNWFWDDNVSAGSVLWQPWRFLDAVVFLIFAGLGWLRLSYQIKNLSVFQEKSVNNGAIACFTLLSAGLFFCQISVTPLPIVAPFLFNVMLFLLAIALLRDGLALGTRRTFWGGMMLLVLGIISRMLEYNTALLLKAFVLALCGIGIIVAGLWFERHLKPVKNRVLNPSQKPL